jgi:hypothetical protein
VPQNEARPLGFDPLFAPDLWTTDADHLHIFTHLRRNRAKEWR